ncbi:MAG: hypothetical protein NT133_22610 [Alphaproteobacteria bacterium]|nr:hypothetical protein [Alphaproteobacteria bacterium]
MVEPLHPMHRIAVQVFVLAVAVATAALDNDWRVLFAGALALPVVAELPRRRVADTRKRPEGWNQADETALRARERWDLLLRYAFWGAWVTGFIIADRASGDLDDKSAYLTRGAVVVLSLLAFLVAAYLSRTAVSARIVRRVTEEIRREGIYPPA